MHCDFCYTNHALHQLAARSFIIDLGAGPLHQSVGAWQACSECARLVAEGDLEGLVARAHESLIRLSPELDDPSVLATLRDVIGAALDAIGDG